MEGNENNKWTDQAKEETTWKTLYGVLIMVLVIASAILLVGSIFNK